MVDISQSGREEPGATVGSPPSDGRGAGVEVPDPRREIAAEAIRQLRQKLLDLSNRNRLLNFRHSERSRTHIRIIDNIPDVLYQRLAEGQPVTFKSLPEP